MCLQVDLQSVATSEGTVLTQVELQQAAAQMSTDQVIQDTLVSDIENTLNQQVGTFTETESSSLKNRYMYISGPYIVQNVYNEISSKWCSKRNYYEIVNKKETHCSYDL